MQLTFLLLQEVVRTEIVLGLLILAAVYAIIILDLLHRTIAALLGSFLVLGAYILCQAISGVRMYNWQIATKRNDVCGLGHLCLGLLSVLHQRPSFLTVMSWIDYNTISLLFGMMIIVGLLRDTGFFEYAAVKAYKIAKGDYWRCIGRFHPCACYGIDPFVINWTDYW